MGNINLTLTRGDSHTFGLTLTNKSDGSVRDITGWTFYLTIKSNITDLDSAAVLQKVVTSHIDPTNGKTTIGIVPTDTFNIEPGDYFYDIQALTNLNNVYTIAKGTMSIEWDATRVYGTAGTGA
jgi:hypothetical protein